LYKGFAFRFQVYATVKEASSNKLSLKMEMGKQHDIRIGVVEKKEVVMLLSSILYISLEGDK